MKISKKRNVRFNENDAVHATQFPFDESKDRWYSVSQCLAATMDADL
jgi:hypothetical protein